MKNRFYTILAALAIFMAFSVSYASAQQSTVQNPKIQHSVKNDHNHRIESASDNSDSQQKSDIQQKTHHCQTTLNKPIIGISSYTDGIVSKLSMTYIESVRKAGGIPFVIPLTTDSLHIAEIVERIDGLIMSGGEDISPSYYNEEPHPKLGEVVPERDIFDYLLIKSALESKKPLLAICRGEQILNVVLGGSLYQDIPSQVGNSIQHSQKAPRDYGSHSIDIKKNSLLYKILKTDNIRVNSFHHQAVKDLGKGLKNTSTSPDGIVESIEIEGEPVLGVQFHPEGFVYNNDLTFLPIFKWLIEAASTR